MHLWGRPSACGGLPGRLVLNTRKSLESPFSCVESKAFHGYEWSSVGRPARPPQAEGLPHSLTWIRF